jgi:hypothetical protein
MIEADGALLSPAQLRVVAEQWRRDARIIETRFAGGSMLPAIAPGQPVTLDCGRMPRVGEVAVFMLENQLGVHRIAARTADTFLPWGDANALPDDPVTPARIIGTLFNIPPRRFNLPRWLLVKLWLNPSRLSITTLRDRVRRLHHRRDIIAAGPAAILAHIHRRRARA